MIRSTLAAYLFVSIVTSSYAQASASCVIDEYEVMRLSLASGTTNVNRCQKELATAQAISALRVVDTYWAHGTTNRTRYALLSKRYQDTIGRIYGVKKSEQYMIPLTEIERVWQGYKVNQINIVAADSIEISLQVSWEQEGYRGTMTYIMALVLEGGKWSIANIHF